MSYFCRDVTRNRRRRSILLYVVIRRRHVRTPRPVRVLGLRLARVPAVTSVRRRTLSIRKNTNTRDTCGGHTHEIGTRTRRSERIERAHDVRVTYFLRFYANRPRIYSVIVSPSRVPFGRPAGYGDETATASLSRRRPRLSIRFYPRPSILLSLPIEIGYSSSHDQGKRFRRETQRENSEIKQIQRISSIERESAHVVSWLTTCDRHGRGAK